MHEIESIFTAKFNRAPAFCVQAPTRINIIGEHTDYNGGLVLPAAINHYIYFGIAKITEPLAFIFDENKQEQLAFDLDDGIDIESLSQWRKYFYGAVKILQEKYELGGFQVLKFGKAPIGAGISSSAALCCGIIYAFNELFNLEMSLWEIAKSAQKVEQKYVGLNCGIMDQFAILFGEENKVLALNCSTLEYDLHSITLGDYEFILCNSMVKHNLAESAYNERVVESAEIIETLNVLGEKKISSLLDIEVSELDALKVLKQEKLFKRARHFLSENARVKAMIEALQKGEMETAGNILSQGHKSLRDDYVVTCAETDDLVEWFIENGAAGARQMGGGFGGCVLVLIAKDKVSAIKETVCPIYVEKYHQELTFIDFEIADGVKIM